MALTYFFIFLFLYLNAGGLWDCICSFIRNGFGWMVQAEELLFITTYLSSVSFLPSFRYSFLLRLSLVPAIYIFGIFTPFYYLFIICFTFFFTFCLSKRSSRMWIKKRRILCRWFYASFMLFLCGVVVVVLKHVISFIQQNGEYD